MCTSKLLAVLWVDPAEERIVGSHNFAGLEDTLLFSLAAQVATRDIANAPVFQDPESGLWIASCPSQLRDGLLPVAIVPAAPWANIALVVELLISLSHSLLQSFVPLTLRDLWLNFAIYANMFLDSLMPFGLCLPQDDLVSLMVDDKSSLPENSAGLFSGTAEARIQLPLLNMDANVVVNGDSAKVVLSQEYCNVSLAPLEVVFNFPVDESAAVCEFTAQIGDGPKLVGQALGKERAAEKYSDAVAAGRTAALLEQKSTDLFQLSVGNLRCGESARITVTYVCPLVIDPQDGTGMVRIPCTTIPRYRSVHSILVALPSEISYSLGLTASVTDSSWSKIACPSHPRSVACSGTKSSGRLAHDQLGRDIRLYFAPSQPRELITISTERKEGDPTKLAVMATVALKALPTGWDTAVKSELFFVIDRSGSMGGEPISAARQALALFLGKLPPSSLFNVIGFGSEYEMLFPSLRPATDSHSMAAAAHLAEIMDANLGGTELKSPLEAIFAIPRTPGFTRQIILITDGAVGNVGELCDIVRVHSGHTKLFCFGVGEGASTELVRSLARVGGGIAQFLSSTDLPEKVSALLEKALQPAIESYNICVVSDTTPGVTAYRSPSSLSPLFVGTPITVYHLLSNCPENFSGILSFTASQGEQSLKIDIPIRCGPEVLPGKQIHVLAAREAIREISLRDPSSPAIEKLGVEWNLASSQTSFVVIEEKDRPAIISGTMKLVEVPLATPRGSSTNVCCCVTGAVSWRVEEIKYRHHFLQIENQVLIRYDKYGFVKDSQGRIQMTSQISGLPEIRFMLGGPLLLTSALENLPSSAPPRISDLDIRLHSAVRMRRSLDSSFVVIPPDQTFSLLEYSNPAVDDMKVALEVKAFKADDPGVIRLCVKLLQPITNLAIQGTHVAMIGEGARLLASLKNKHPGDVVTVWVQLTGPDPVIGFATNPVCCEDHPGLRVTSVKVLTKDARECSLSSRYVVLQLFPL